MRILMHRGFLACLEDLARADRKRVLEFIEKLQTEPSAAGLRAHKVGNFLSLSPSMRLRVLAQPHGAALVLLHVDDHDNAYRWAERHEFVAAEATGTFEIVRLAERAAERATPSASAPSYGAELAVRLERLGAPRALAASVRSCASEDALCSVLSTMSPEWQERVMHIATSDESAPVTPVGVVSVVAHDAALSSALASPLAQWRVFLHSRQRQAVDARDGRQLAVLGGPGTGKSVVCVHRAVSLARTVAPGEVVVLFTYSINLVKDLREMVDALLPDPGVARRRIWVEPCHAASEIERERGTILDVQGGDVILRRSDGSLRSRVVAMVVDEAHDCPDYFMAFVDRALSQSSCGSVTLAIDPNQTIFRSSNEEALARFVKAARVVHLSYCYRMTAQLLRNSMRVLELFAASHADAIEVGAGFVSPVALLRGPSVRYTQAPDSAALMAAARSEVQRLTAQYPEPGAVVLIHVQYWSPHFAKSGKVDPLAEQLKADPITGPHYRFAASTKGKEWLAGVAVCPADFMARDAGAGTILRLNTLYVSLTRVRDELSVIVAEGSPAARYLPASAEG